MKNYIKLLGFLVFFTVIGFSMTACDDGNDNDVGGIDLRLVLADGYAWTYGNNGSIFRADGTYSSITTNNGGTTWTIISNGTWRIINTGLSVNGTSPSYYTVSADGTMFTWEDMIHTRTQVTITS